MKEQNVIEYNEIYWNRMKYDETKLNLKKRNEM